MPLGRHIVLVDFFDLLLDALDHFAAVLPPKHHDDPADRLIPAVDHGGPLPHSLTDLHFGDVADEYGGAGVGFQNDILYVRSVFDQSYASDDILI